VVEEEEQKGAPVPNTPGMRSFNVVRVQSQCKPEGDLDAMCGGSAAINVRGREDISSCRRL
jgi:hypothetical protein